MTNSNYPEFFRYPRNYYTPISSSWDDVIRNKATTDFLTVKWHSNFYVVSVAENRFLQVGYTLETFTFPEFCGSMSIGLYRRHRRYSDGTKEMFYLVGMESEKDQAFFQISEDGREWEYIGRRT